MRMTHRASHHDTRLSAGRPCGTLHLYEDKRAETEAKTKKNSQPRRMNACVGRNERPRVSLGRWCCLVVCPVADHRDEEVEHEMLRDELVVRVEDERAERLQQEEADQPGESLQDQAPPRRLVVALDRLLLVRRHRRILLGFGGHVSADGEGRLGRVVREERLGAIGGRHGGQSERLAGGMRGGYAFPGPGRQQRVVDLDALDILLGQV